MARHGKVTKFLKVKCKDCENEQLVFNKPAMRVACNVCGATLAESVGGLGKIMGEVTAEFT